MSSMTPSVERLRLELGAKRGRRFWRSLEELSGSAELRELLEREFPQGASEWDDPAGRRRFLKLSAASLGLAGLAACTRQPLEHIVPYVDAPESFVPGKPLFFATSTELRGVAQGALVESHMGRPTKVEGNAEHPAGTGASDLWAQASVLELYDPDRSQVVLNAGRIGTWDAFFNELQPALERQRATSGAGLRLLTGAVSSPTLERQIGELLEEYPDARWHVYEPVPRDAIWQGTERLFGRRLEPLYRFENADVVVALEGDFLSTSPGVLSYTRAFVARRRPENAEGLSRVYAIEPTPTLVGAMADHRFRARPDQMTGFTRALARELGLDVPAAELSEPLRSALPAIARDLRERGPRSLVLAGEHQPAEIHALAQAMNAALGASGTTVDYIRPVEAFPEDYTGSLRSMTELVEAMNAGTVEMLAVFGGNPVHDAPPELDFASAFSKVPFRIHQGLYADDTAALAHWHVPLAQALESWGDARSFEGTVTLRQPLIEPLYDGKTPYELARALMGRTGPTARELVRATHAASWGDDAETRWRRALHDGFIEGTRFELEAVDAVARLELVAPAAGGDGLFALFRPDPTVFDGRFANNGWLQEMPKSFTKLTWDNAALLSPATAERLGVQSEDVVEIAAGESRVEAPVFVLPGQADDVVTLHLGYGRSDMGRVANGAGFDANRLRTSESSLQRTGVTLRPTGASASLATTQHHQSMEGRALVREATAEEYAREPDFPTAHHHEPGEELSLYPPREWTGDYAWGMSIDLATCTGCNACVAACQSENNSPVIGKEEVRRGREMHWIRIDRYFEGPPDAPRIHHQPVTCMHCEHAPCEVVCPVAATMHNDEGLNTMIYNRCVGTRYCSNNCPYKVRRFNFLLYSDWETPVHKLLNNPDVTVRSRGVMEKCTYCVQRINEARIGAEKEDRFIEDGEVVTACQQACPAEAIVFGDLKRTPTRVSEAKSLARSYGLLTELGTRPRTTYLAKVRNPNPALADGAEEGEG